MVERANALRLSQGPSISPLGRKSPSSDSGQSTLGSPNRPNIHVRRHLPEPPSSTPWSRPPPNATYTYEAGRGAGNSPSPRPAPSATREASPKSQPTSAASHIVRKLEPYMASIDNTLKCSLAQVNKLLERLDQRLAPVVPNPNDWTPYMAQVNKIVERLDQHLAPVVPPFKELAPYIKQVNVILERLTVESIQTKRLAPAVPPQPQRKAVPTPEAPSNQRTTIQYLVKRSDIGTYREAQPTSPGESRQSDGSDTPPSEFATPGRQSPETVDWGADLTECQVNGESTDEAGTLPTWPRKVTSDTHGPNEQPSDLTLFQGDNTVRFNWRVDLKDNNYKYDRLVEPVGHTEQRGQRHTSLRATAALNL